MIEILEIRLQNGNKPLKAFVDIQIKNTIIRDFRIIQEDGKRPWVATPQVSWKDKTGQIKYKTIITFPDDLKGQIDLAILNSYAREMEGKHGITTK
jgi:DNA-binding cell septation regulator SpoVG